MIAKIIIPRDGLSFSQNTPLELSLLRWLRFNLVKFLGKSLNQFFEVNYKVCNEGLTNNQLNAVGGFRDRCFQHSTS